MPPINQVLYKCCCMRVWVCLYIHVIGKKKWDLKGAAKNCSLDVQKYQIVVIQKCIKPTGCRYTICSTYPKSPEEAIVFDEKCRARSYCCLLNIWLLYDDILLVLLIFCINNFIFLYIHLQFFYGTFF